MIEIAPEDKEVIEEFTEAIREFAKMVGQWVEPGGGLPAVALSGRNLAQIICKKDKKKFQ